MIKINLKQIKERFSRIISRDKFKSFLTPYRDWKIIVISFFILFVIIGIANAYFFIQIDAGKIFFKVEKKPTKNFEVLNVSGLKKTVQFFGNKEKNFEALSKEKLNIVDPSL